MNEINHIKSFGKGPAYRPGSMGRDARALMLVFFSYMVFVVSVPKYGIFQLALFAAFPVFFIISTGMALKPILKKLMIVAPFILFLGIFNPFLDTAPIYTVGSVEITGGMVSFTVILLKGIFSVLAIVILTGIIPFYEICTGLAAIKVPQPFIVQLLFLYRYLFVLVEEADAMRKARDLRSFKGRGRGVKATVGLLGTLFLRTLDKSQRIYRSMISKGFQGEIHAQAGRQFDIYDGLFVCLFLTFFFLLRFYNFFHITILKESF